MGADDNRTGRTVPVKYEHVVFCALSPFQLDLYKYFVKSPAAQALIKGKESQPLKAITLLRKLCNHPDLLNMAEDLPGSEATWPPGYDPYDRRQKLDPYLSGKMAVLDRYVVAKAWSGGAKGRGGGWALIDKVCSFAGSWPR